MADAQRFGWPDLLLLALILAAAAGARAGYLVTCADGGNGAGPLIVQDESPLLTGLPEGTEFRGRDRPTEFDALVHNLKEHGWFGVLAPFAAVEEQTAHTSPGYPWLVGLLARAVPETQVDYLVRWIQCGLGALTAGLYFLFSLRAFGIRTVAALAGLFTAVYPFWVVNVAALNDGTLTALLLALVLYLGARASQTAGPFASLLYGLSLAGLALVRAALLPLAFVALVWFLLHSRTLVRGWLCALVAFLGFATGLASWTVRNVQVLGEPVPIVNSTYYHLWVGNNPHATGGPVTARALLDAPAAELALLDQTARFHRLGERVRDEVARDPAGALKRSLWALLYFLLGERWFRASELAEVRSGATEQPAWVADAAAQVLPATLLALLLLGGLGWRWTHAWRAESMPAALAVVWLPLPYLLGHAEALHGPRLPLDGVLLCYAAFALVCLVPGPGARLLRGPAGREEGHHPA